MKRKRTLFGLLTAALVVASLGLTACGDDDDEGGGGGGGQARLNLTIGDIVPLTGDLSDFGPPGRKSADLAVQQITQGAREAGANHTVKVSHADGQTDPQAGVQAARKLLADGSTCIAGAWATAVTIPVARSVAIREEVPLISPASTAVQISDLEDDGYVNRTAPPDSLQAETLVRTLDRELDGVRGKTVNVGARNDTYGTGLAQAFSEELEQAGGQIGEQVIYEPEQPSYNSEARTITSGNPDAYVIIDFPETYAKVGPALVRTGNFDGTKAFVTDGLASSELPGDVGREATEGAIATAPGAFSGAAPNAFDRLYRRAGGPDRQTFDSQNFDAVMLCYLGAVAAGSTESNRIVEELQAVTAPPGRKYTFEQLPQAIRALQNGDDIDYEGASGPINWDEKGDLTSYVYDVSQYKNGKLVKLRTVNERKGE